MSGPTGGPSGPDGPSEKSGSPAAAKRLQHASRMAGIRRRLPIAQSSALAGSKRHYCADSRPTPSRTKSRPQALHARRCRDTRFPRSGSADEIFAYSNLLARAVPTGRRKRPPDGRKSEFCASATGCSGWPVYHLPRASLPDGPGMESGSPPPAERSRCKNPYPNGRRPGRRQASAADAGVTAQGRSCAPNSSARHGVRTSVARQ